MKKLDWQQLLDTLSVVERLGESRSGFLAIGDEGGLFVEGGRICWIAAQGLERRLRDLLLESSSVDDARLDEVYERCRREGLVLGQTLVEDGVIGARELENALRRHSAESLLHLSRKPQALKWTPRAGRGYAAQFTFRPLDVLLDVVGIVHPEARETAERRLQGFQGSGRLGVAFLLDPNFPAPLPLAEFASDTLSRADAVGRAGLAVAEAHRELGGVADFSLSTTSQGAGTLTWQEAAVLFTLVCENRESLVEATSRHLRRAS